MPEKDTNLWAWVLAWLTAIVGGGAAYAMELARGVKLTPKDLMIDLIPSLFWGMVTAALSYVAGLHPIFGGAIAGVAGHYAARATAEYAQSRRIKAGGTDGTDD